MLKLLFHFVCANISLQFFYCRSHFKGKRRLKWPVWEKEEKYNNIVLLYTILLSHLPFLRKCSSNRLYSGNDSFFSECWKLSAEKLTFDRLKPSSVWIGHSDDGFIFLTILGHFLCRLHCAREVSFIKSFFLFVWYFCV